uniref:Uncharacterized protein n=1 Tax=Candidatus Methanogaster sp. ANME-2c ERB4 TaxID=2759911 RepID=A0A7G9YNW8_9EURY|nr:hypothetical protein BFOKDAJI_00003 [Methanosarcinales archaeon ANME-2c ERB4]QNO49730.1 hypothetical protein BFOKDAJI_00032 [Methanosarcinales archaeon ANME-2c ERB4]QNO50512.1 hypothetical protein LKCECFIB_00004 [Methanosarcinales archaeon ANME-2c ERB4]QNO50669.1 hypothetical protein FFGHKCHG_00023 [Methanosarcinales archaeon ANME-2c ERB4]
MKLDTKIVILLLIATITVTFSGCIEENEVAPEPEPLQPEPLHNDTTNISAVNRTLLPGIENGLKIRIVSFSSVYMRDNKDEEGQDWTYNLSERYYAAYNLSITNNGSDVIDFRANDLRLRAGDQLLNTTTRKLYNSSLLEVLADLGNENRIEDATLPLSPGQTVNGSAVFCVYSLYDRSFLLMYGATPVTSASFEESFEALEAAERFDYSQVFGIPPYSIHRTADSYKPDHEAHPFIWANWVNRSVFEFYKTADFETVQGSPPDNIPVTEIWYAIKVLSERNITVVSGGRLLVIDDFGEELINRSRGSGVAILRNRTYESQPWRAIDIPQMNVSDATIVQISFAGICGWGMEMRASFNNQDVIIDDELNITLARYYNTHMIS